MPGMPWPQDSEEAELLFDHCTLGPHFLPGFTAVEVDGGIDIDKGKAGNKHGATLTLKGTKPRSVKITWKVWGDDDGEWQEMQDILADLESPRGKKDLTPWVIFHPITNIRSINYVVIENIKGPSWSDGYMVVDLACIESNPPTAGKGLGTAKGAKSGDGSQWEQQPSKDGTIVVGAPVIHPDGSITIEPVEVPKSSVKTDAEKEKPSSTATGPDDA